MKKLINVNILNINKGEVDNMNNEKIDENKIENNEEQVCNIVEESFEDKWNKFDILRARAALYNHKAKLVQLVKEDLMNIIMTNANDGISVFDTPVYPKCSIKESNTVFDKLNDEDVKQIMKEFKNKGIYIKEVGYSRDSVKFNINLNK